MGPGLVSERDGPVRVGEGPACWQPMRVARGRRAVAGAPYVRTSSGMGPADAATNRRAVPGVALLVAAIWLVWGLAPGVAHADRFRWSPGAPSYPQVAAWEWAAGATALAGGLTAFLFWHPERPRWTGPIAFEGPVQDALRVRNDHTRRVLSGVSDVPFFLLMFAPSVVDVGIAVAGVRGRPGVATQLVGMNLMSYGVAALLSYTVSAATARQRPLGVYCPDNPNYDAGCGDAGAENSSFFSGHVAAAFVGAGTTCAHHEHLPIYGEPWDTVACATTLAMASSIAVLRVMTDNHYLSDVLVGVGVGLGAGYALPRLLHYQHAATATHIRVAPQPMGTGFGLVVRID